MSTQFSVGPTRDVQPGDTPDLNDGLLSRPVAAQNLLRGQVSYINQTTGHVGIATTALQDAGDVPFVPIESVDNSGGPAGGLEISGVTAPQRVAVTIALVGAQTAFPGTYLKIQNGTGALILWVDGDTEPKYARFLGIEAALLDRAVVTPFDESLTPGIVPDQSVTGTDISFVGWVQLIESTAI